MRIYENLMYLLSALLIAIFGYKWCNSINGYKYSTRKVFILLILTMLLMKLVIVYLTPRIVRVTNYFVNFVSLAFVFVYTSAIIKFIRVTFNTVSSILPETNMFPAVVIFIIKCAIAVSAYMLFERITDDVITIIE